MRIDDGSGLPVLKANPISLVAVLQYSGKAIDPSGKMGLEPNKFYGVLRPDWELFDPEAMNSFNGVPLIDEHEMVGEGAKKIDSRPADGCIMNVRPSQDLQGVLIADFKIYTESIMQKIKDGKVQLSLGYRCRYRPSKGVFKGVPYEFVQEHLRGNHIALVKHGRCGSGVRVYDSSEVADVADAEEVLTCDSLEEVDKMTNDKKQEMQTALDSLAECLSGCSDEMALDVLEFVKNWKPKGTEAEDGNEGKEEAQAAEAKEDAEAKSDDGTVEVCDKCKKPKGECECGKGDVKTEDCDIGKKAEDCGESKDDKGDKPLPPVPPKDDKKPEDEGEAKPEDTEAKDAAEIARDLAAGDELANKIALEIGNFDHAEMGEAAVAHYACEQMGVSFDSAEAELGFIKGVCSKLGNEKTVTVSACDSAESAAKSEAIRTAQCRAAYLGN